MTYINILRERKNSGWLGVFYFKRSHISHFQMSQWNKITWVYTNNMMQQKTTTTMQIKNKRTNCFSSCADRWSPPTERARCEASLMCTCIYCATPGWAEVWYYRLIRTLMQLYGKDMLLNESARMATKIAQISVLWGENHLWAEACRETPCGEGNPEKCQERKTSYQEEEDREAPWEKR